MAAPNVIPFRSREKAGYVEVDLFSAENYFGNLPYGNPQRTRAKAFRNGTSASGNRALVHYHRTLAWLRYYDFEISQLEEAIDKIPLDDGRAYVTAFLRFVQTIVQPAERLKYLEHISWMEQEEVKEEMGKLRDLSPAHFR